MRGLDATCRYPEDSVWQSYCNAPPHATDKLHRGRVVVSIGEADLGGLAMAAKIAEGSLADPGSDVPAAWVGFELSAYSVAKSKVLLQMMRAGDDIEHVLQVRRVRRICARFEADL